MYENQSSQRRHEAALPHRCNGPGHQRGTQQCLVGGCLLRQDSTQAMRAMQAAAHTLNTAALREKSGVKRRAEREEWKEKESEQKKTNKQKNCNAGHMVVHKMPLCVASTGFSFFLHSKEKQEKATTCVHFSLFPFLHCCL